MQGYTKGWWIVLMLMIALNGCGRNEGTGNRVEMGVVAQESDQWGYLPLMIERSYGKQKPLEQAPWHEDGGDWIFLDCSLTTAPSVKVVIGARTGSAVKGNMSLSWGEAMLAVDDPAAGAQLVESLARAFHTALPGSHGSKPAGFIKMHTAVLGSNQTRNKHDGSFREGRSGTWTATKWFLEDETAEVEVYFNFSVAEKKAEFAEKDEDYREDLIAQLVVALRDGPLPERTPENDPNLTLSGPRVINWQRVGTASEGFRFSPDGGVIAITTYEKGAGTRIFSAPVTSPTQRTLLAKFDGLAGIRSFLSLKSGLTLLVEETSRLNPNSISTSDPQKLWMVDVRGRKEIAVPGNLTNWSAGKDCVSPDGGFIALTAWQKDGREESQIIHLGSLKSGEWRKVEVPGVQLEPVGWTGEPLTGVVLTGNEFTKEVRKGYLLDLVRGELTPLAMIPTEFVPTHRLSPDRRRTVEVIEKERFIVTDLATGQKREFVFHPHDRRNAYRESVQWAGNNYLVFQSARTALIDAETLKMSFVELKDSGIKSVEFGPGFKFALGLKPDGHYLGEVRSGW